MSRVMLTKHQLQGYTRILEDERKKILSQIEDDKAALNFGDESLDPDEETDEAEELGNELGVEQILKRRVQAIDNALNRIVRGTYGTCSACGKEIPEKVLLAAPESELCDACKKTQ